MLAWLCVAAAVSYLSRNAIGVAESTIRSDLRLTKDQSGFMLSAFFVSYAVCQIPGAWLGQRFGARRALPAFAVVWSLATALTGGAGFWLLVVARIIKGLAQAGLFPVSTGVIANWFPKHGQAFATGALGSFMSVGGAVTAGLTGWLIVDLGWRWMFVLYGLPGLLWAGWFWIWFRDHPQQHPAVNAAERQLIRPEAAEAARVNAGGRPSAASPHPVRAGHDGTGTAAPTPWLLLLSSPAMWCICGQQFFRAAGYTFFTSWFATYLQEARGVTIKGSGMLTMLPLLAVVAGSLIGGGVSDGILRRTGSRRLARQTVAVVSLGLCAILSWSALFFANTLSAVLIISAGSFFAAVAGPCGYTITIDMGGQHIPTVNSVMNMCGNLGAMLLPLAVPRLLSLTGRWETVLLSFGAVYIAAALCWWTLKPEGDVFAQALLGKETATTKL